MTKTYREISVPQYQYTITGHPRGQGRYGYEIQMWIGDENVKGVDVSRLTPRALEVWNQKGPTEEVLDQWAEEKRSEELPYLDGDPSESIIVSFVKVAL